MYSEVEPWWSNVESIISRVSFGQFDATEPPLTTVTNSEAGLQRRFESQWRRGKQPNLLEALVMNGEAGLQGSKFGEVEVEPW